VTEGPLALAPIVAPVMIGGQFRVFRFVQLDAVGFNVFFEEIMNAQKLDTLVSKPILQTKPGRKVGVASLRQEQILTFKFFVVLHNPPNNL
jgi:hypothetical protein